jgi:CDP-glycerol glycerophosphotransferase (TagB/SpsB family)
MAWLFPFLHAKIFCRGRGKRVLLVAQNSVAADHLRLVSDLLRDAPDMAVYTTNDWFPAREFKKHELVRMIRRPCLHIVLALLRHWDLIIFSNHPFGLGIWFSPNIKKLYINHGLHTGKINNVLGHDGVYGRSRLIRPFSYPYYDRMFASSHFERKLAERETPELAGRISVTGFLVADRFLEGVAIDDAGMHCKTEASSRDKPVVHIISTWGENSLYHTMGERILEQAVRLTEKYQFVFSLHPRFNYIHGGTGEDREAILDRYERRGLTINRDLDWQRHVARSDVAISDHSSLVLYHVLLGHPVMLVNVDSDQYVEGSVFSLLNRFCPRLEPGIDLDEALQRLSASHEETDYSAVIDAMLSYRGEAAVRYREEIDSMLYPP